MQNNYFLDFNYYFFYLNKDISLRKTSYKFANYR